MGKKGDLSDLDVGASLSFSETADLVSLVQAGAGGGYFLGILYTSQHT